MGVFLRPAISEFLPKGGYFYGPPCSRGGGTCSSKSYGVYGFSITRKSVYVVGARGEFFRFPTEKWVCARAKTHLLDMGRFPNLYNLSLRIDARSGEIPICRSGFSEFVNPLAPLNAWILGLETFLNTTFLYGKIRAE